MSIPSLVTQNPAVQIVTATKPLVDALLSINTRNRRPKQGHMKRLGLDMKSGNFYLTASGIGVSKTGVLLDGQNRLIAIKDAGYPAVQFVLATGLEDESQRVVDRHAKRNLSDVLTMHMNITVSSHMVALVNAIAAMGATNKSGFTAYRSRDAQSLTDTVVADFLVDHAELAVDVIQTSKQVKAPVLAALWVYAYHHREMALEFAHQIGTGIGLSENSPARRLRLAMERLKSNNAAPGRQELFRLAASSCISHYQNKEVKLLKPVESWESARWKWKIKGRDIFDSESE